jgi:hypothetical protein
VVYLAFGLYLLLMILAAAGIYKLLAGLIKPAATAWLLLPGTIVSEMGYIFGCLITGGEIRRAKLIDSGGKPKAGEGGGSGGAHKGGSGADVAQKSHAIGSLAGALMSIVACGACIVVAHQYLGQPVVQQYTMPAEKSLAPARLPVDLPNSANTFWGQVHNNIYLLQRMCTVVPELKWDWRIGLFIYLVICLAIRMAPISRSLRASLAAAVVLSGGLALVGLAWPHGPVPGQLWPLLSFLWACLLLVLVATLLLRGGIGLFRALSGQHAKPMPKPAT